MAGEGNDSNELASGLMGKDVFISYRRDDQIHVKKILERLRKATEDGEPIWMDSATIELGDLWKQFLSKHFAKGEPPPNESKVEVETALDNIPEAAPSVLVTDKVNLKLVEYFAKNPGELKSMNRRLFEEMIAEIWAGFGYEVELTKRTRDGGKDIIAVRNTTHEEKLLIECKRPDPGNLIAVSTVRELYGVKADDKATKAILATTSHFSPDAKLFIERNRWELEGRDYDGLLGWVADYLRAKK